MQILPPSACTASVTRRCRATSRGLDNLPANGLTHPARFGAIPPVTSKPAPPRALAAKYAASLGKSRARSSSPVCIEPMTMRFGSRVNPRSSGANKRPYFMGSECSGCRLSARDLRHEFACERVFRRDQQRALERFARADHVALLVECTAEKRIGFRGAPLRRRGQAGARGFEHDRHGAQVLDRGRLLVEVLPGAVELGERLDQAHARILRLELHRLVDTSADATAAE